MATDPPPPFDPKRDHSFIKGVPRAPGLGYVLCADDDKTANKVPHSDVMVFEAGRLALAAKNPYLTAGVCVARSPLEQLVAVGEEGDVFVGGSGDVHNEVIGTPGHGPRDIAILRGVRAIDGLAYAAGMRRQVYRRVGRDAWVRLDTGPLPELGDVVGFESIDGFGHNDLYAVGWKGEIWRGKDGEWAPVTSPTNLILTDVCCAADGEVYCCGQQGVVLRGRGESWTVVDNPAFGVDLWGLTFFEGHLYVAGFSVLLRLEDDILVPVDTAPVAARTFGHLRHTDGVMWSTGASDLIAFDGATWTRLG